jgi:hypothetical protein
VGRAKVRDHPSYQRFSSSHGHHTARDHAVISEPLQRQRKRLSVGRSNAAAFHLGVFGLPLLDYIQEPASR